jgi:hypothetical protein
MQNRPSQYQQQEMSPQYMKINSRISVQLSHLLQNESCPTNIVQARDKLLSLCHDEHKSSYSVNLDREIAATFSLHCVEPLLKVNI